MNKNPKIIILVIIFAAITSVLAIQNEYSSFPSVDDLIWQANALNPFHKYDINTNCELFYFFENEIDAKKLPQSLEEFSKKYPLEFQKIKEYSLTPESMNYLSTFPLDNTKMPQQIKEAMASVMIKTYSINPKLEPSVIDVLGYGLTPFYQKIILEEPDCEQKIREKQSKQEQAQIPTVIQIGSVLKGSGAEKAGLQAGDIITAINDTKISFVSDLSKIKLQPGKTVIVSVLRDGKALKIPVTVDPAKDDPQKGILGIVRAFSANDTSVIIK